MSMAYSTQSSSQYRKVAHSSWVIPCGLRSTHRLNPFSSKISQQNTHFDVYIETSKRQEGSPCKNFHLNCFNRFHRKKEQDEFNTLSHHLKVFATRRYPQSKLI